MIRRYLALGCLLACTLPLAAVAQQPKSEDPAAKEHQPKTYKFDPKTGCPEEMLKLDPLSSFRFDVSLPKGDTKVPSDCAAPYFQNRDRRDAYDRGWADQSFDWVAPDLCHYPLYFEDVPLERYGQTRHPLIQPAVSAGRFYASVPLLPYKMWIMRPGECLSVLGYYRPGSPTPPVRQRLPIRADAGAFEVAVGTAMFFLIP